MENSGAKCSIDPTILASVSLSLSLLTVKRPRLPMM